MKNLEESAGLSVSWVLTNLLSFFHPTSSFAPATGSGKLSELYQELGSIEVGTHGRESLVQ